MAYNDLVNLVDFDKMVHILVEEIIIKSGAVSPDIVKNIEFVRRKPGMPFLDFHRYWQNVHGPLAAKIGMIRRYIQSHTLMIEYEKDTPPAYGGVAETWFDNTAAMRQSAAPEYAATRAADKNFVSREGQFVNTKEIQIF